MCHLQTLFLFACGVLAYEWLGFHNGRSHWERWCWPQCSVWFGVGEGVASLPSSTTEGLQLSSSSTSRRVTACSSSDSSCCFCQRSWDWEDVPLRSSFTCFFGLQEHLSISGICFLPTLKQKFFKLKEILITTAVTQWKRVKSQWSFSFFLNTKA